MSSSAAARFPLFQNSSTNCRIRFFCASVDMVIAPRLPDRPADTLRLLPRWTAGSRASIPRLWYFIARFRHLQLTYWQEDGMDRERAWQRAERDIVQLSHAGLDSPSLRLEALRRLRKIVPVDAFFCATVDPATLLFTGSLTEEIPESATPDF